MKFKLGMLAAGMAMSLTAGAQTWSTDFTTLKGSFDSAASGGTIETYPVSDNVLALFAATTASFTFTTLTATPYFLVQFWTSTNGGPDNGGTVAVGLGGQTQGFAVPNPANIGPNPNPDGVLHSYHYGTAGVQWAPGTYTLTFDNAPASGFRLDDVSVTAVPEPSSIVFATMGLAGIGFLMARRRKGGTGL